MNRIVCAISLIIGCFGQQDIVSKPSNLISAPVVTSPQNGTPKLPALVNGIPELPQLPNGVTNLPLLVNGAPGLPQPPNGETNLPPLINGVPGLPQPPSGVTNLPPLVNGVPGLPLPPNGVTNLPPLVNGVPGLPVPPNGVTNLPPFVNSVPGLTKPPNGIPNLPPSPAIPITTAPEVFERPCRPSDLACIQRYFLYHGQCRPAPGGVADPLLRPIANIFYPRVNITQTILNYEYKGLNNGRIQEFYINRDTDKLVIGIELRDLENTSKDVFFRYYRRGREPIITHGSGSVLFRSVYLTVTIPQVENLRLDKADSFAFSNDLPIVNLEPSLGQSSDASVPVAYAAFLSDMSTNVAEYFFTESSFLAATYIQYVICDFGLQVI